MVSERMRRQLERLLDEAETAVTADDWAAVANKARAALEAEAQREAAHAARGTAEASRVELARLAAEEWRVLKGEE